MNKWNKNQEKIRKEFVLNGGIIEPVVINRSAVLVNGKIVEKYEGDLI